MTRINIMDGNECAHLTGIPRPLSCTPERSATSEEDPPDSPHRLHATGQLAGSDVKACPLPEHPPPNLPTYCTTEWPATRTGICCTQPSTDESQTQSYDSYDSTIYQRVADAVIRLIRLNHPPMSCRRTHTTHTTQPSSDESQEHPHHQRKRQSI